MTIDEQIKVMEHYAEGGEVEYTVKGINNWDSIEEPAWDWYNGSYRIKSKEKEKLWFWKIFRDDSRPTMSQRMYTEKEVPQQFSGPHYTHYIKLEVLGFEYKED